MCYVHSDRKHLATGFVEEVRRKIMTCRLEIGGEEYYAEVRIDAIAYNRKPSAGRYIAISPKGRVHLCSCRWTKAMIRDAEKRANELWELMQQCAEYPTAD